MPFPEILQSLMDANNISRYRLSKIIGCSQSTIKYWIDGATVPQNRTMQAIADAFGVSVAFLQGKDEEEKAEETHNNKETSAAEEAIKAALWHDDTDLTKEDIDELWDEIRAYKEFKTAQRRKKKND